MAQGRSTVIISMIEWIRTIRLSIKNSLSLTVRWQVLTLTGHSVDVYSVAIFPDGKRVVSASKDNLVKIWDCATGAEVSSHGGCTWWGFVLGCSGGRRGVGSRRVLNLWCFAVAHAAALSPGVVFCDLSGREAHRERVGRRAREDLGRRDRSRGEQRCGSELRVAG